MISAFDSHVNFQLWFYEDGDIELRIGPSNLDNSPVYIPGEGFFLLTGNAGPIPLGPQLALYHPFDESNRIEYNDLESHEEYEFNNYVTGTIDWWPPEGWVIQFSNELVSSVDVEEIGDVFIFPNPALDQMKIVSPEKIKSVSIFDMNGRFCLEHKGHIINTTDLVSGFHILKLEFESQKIIKKLFLKI